MSKPARHDLKFHSIDDLLSDAGSLKISGYEKTGQWDLAMVLDHLGKAMNAPWAADAQRVPWPFSIVARLLIRRMVSRQFYPTIKFPSPKSMRPDPNVSLENADAAFREAAEKIKACNGPTIAGTPFGTLPLDDFVKMHLLHGAHHLGFLTPA